MKKSIFGLDENIAAMVAYLGTFITGIIILILERENKTVRFAALQSTIFFIGMAIISTVVGWLMIFIGWIPFLGGLVSSIITGGLGLITFVAWIYLSYTAFKGQKVKVPMLGDIVEEQINK